MSPWIPAGAVFQEPKGKGPNSQFDLSSIPGTAKTLFNLTHYLTKRDAWSGSLEELLTLDEPSNQGPLHLPDAPPGWDESEHGAGRRRMRDDGTFHENEPQVHKDPCSDCLT